jgi:hypothetical protein
VITVIPKVICGYTCRFVTNTTTEKLHTHVMINETIARSTSSKQNGGVPYELTG